MKLKITLIVALLIASFGFSQTKVGTVDTDFVMGKMPEMKEVITRINSYGKQLDSSFQVKAKDYSAKIEAFKKIEKTLKEEDKKKKINEIAVVEQEMAKFRKNGSTLIQLRRDEFMKPLYKKLNAAIQEIAKAEGYTQILSTRGNDFAYIDDRFDITNKVMAKLGIKE
ncbi:OmpH family outer membrane protein [Tenacibaculum xiamenense]|uniref:OmpH family outer membrane protein n=1 Tax=Tenacibaculum xiamenense TaxID=1261553 RepID=UPI003896704C